MSRTAVDIDEDEPVAPHLEIKFVGEMQRLQIQDGDVLVLRCPSALSQQVRERLSQMLKAITPEGIKVKTLVLEDGMDLGVVSKKR